MLQVYGKLVFAIGALQNFFRVDFLKCQSLQKQFLIHSLILEV